MLGKLRAMRELVKGELEHVEKGNMLQNELRMIYWVSRMHSLGRKAESVQSKEEVLKGSIEFIKREHPDFTPQYDKRFFKS